MGDIECGDVPAYGDGEYIAIASSLNEEECVALLEKDTSKTDSGAIPKSRNSTPTSETSFIKLLLSFAMGVTACFAIQYTFPSLCFASSPARAPPCAGSFNIMVDAGSQVVSSEILGITQQLSFTLCVRVDIVKVSPVSAFYTNQQGSHSFPHRGWIPRSYADGCRSGYYCNRPLVSNT